MPPSPNNPVERTAHSTGFLSCSRRFPLWAAAHRERSAPETFDGRVAQRWCISKRDVGWGRIVCGLLLFRPWLFSQGQHPTGVGGGGGLKQYHRRLGGPGAFDQHTSGRGVPGLGRGTWLASLTRGVFRGHQPQECHPFSWVLRPREVAHGGLEGDGHGALPTAQGPCRASTTGGTR